jgi:hypothetical protein
MGAVTRWLSPEARRDSRRARRRQAKKRAGKRRACSSETNEWPRRPDRLRSGLTDAAAILSKARGGGFWHRRAIEAASMPAADVVVALTMPQSRV